MHRVVSCSTLKVLEQEKGDCDIACKERKTVLTGTEQGSLVMQVKDAKEQMR